jgi:hypothetical protein
MANLHAQWIVGFVDGEGCFHIALNSNRALKFGKEILPEFTVVQHQRDIDLLYSLKTYWKCGVVRKNHGQGMAYRVRGIDDLVTKIIPFFEKHPLKTKKHVEFLKFRDIVYQLGDTQHLTQEGFITLCHDINLLRKYSCLSEDKVQPLTSFEVDPSLTQFETGMREKYDVPHENERIH